MLNSVQSVSCWFVYSFILSIHSLAHWLWTMVCVLFAYSIIDHSFLHLFQSLYVHSSSIHPSIYSFGYPSFRFSASHLFVRSFTNFCVHSFDDSLPYSDNIHSFIHKLACFIHSFGFFGFNSFTHFIHVMPATHLLVHSFDHSFIYSFTAMLVPLSLTVLILEYIVTFTCSFMHSFISWWDLWGDGVVCNLPPSIIKTGQYTLPPPTNNHIIMNKKY